MVERLTPARLHEKLENGEDVHVVDIRPEGAFARGHIPGAENVPYLKLADRIADVDWGEEVVVVCPEGQSSVQAGRILESYEGIDDDAVVASLDGGYDEWEYDLETEE